MLKNRGFTLIEILIVLVIVAILAAIAVPSYQNSVMKSRRADAKAALSAASLLQEKWLFQFNTYSNNIDDIGGPSSNEGFYSVAVETTGLGGSCVNAAPFNCYRLTATPAAGSPQNDDAECTSFILTNTGARSATGSNTDACW